jgi:hypothetical protein
MEAGSYDLANRRGPWGRASGKHGSTAPLSRTRTFEFINEKSRTTYVSVVPDRDCETHPQRHNDYAVYLSMSGLSVRRQVSTGRRGSISYETWN